jgi:hypothetical protein
MQQHVQTTQHYIKEQLLQFQMLSTQTGNSGLRGITKLLQKYYKKTYSYTKKNAPQKLFVKKTGSAVGNNATLTWNPLFGKKKGNKKKRNYKQKYKYQYKKRYKRNSRKSAIRFGTAVDKQCNSLVESAGSNSNVTGSPSSAPGKVAQSVLQFLQNKGWVPVAAQFNVASPQHKLKTAIDQVWYDPESKEYVLVELKVCQAGWYNIPGGHLPPPYTAVASTPFNHHQLQTALGEYMFRNTCVGLPVRSVIVRAHGDGIFCRELQKWVKDQKRFEQFLAIIA